MSTSTTANDAALLVVRLAQMLQAARINSDSDYEATKRLVAEASSLTGQLNTASTGLDQLRSSLGGGTRPVKWNRDRS